MPTPRTSTTLSIIVPSRNKASRLRLGLLTLAKAVEEHVAARPGDDVEVVVIDDGSTDSTHEVLAAAAERFGRRLHSLSHGRPRGRAVTRNRGAAVAGGRRLLFLDDDILVDAPLLAAHADAAPEVVARGAILGLPWLRHLADPMADNPSLPSRLRARVGELAREGTAAAPRHARRSAFEADLQALLEREGSGRWPAATGGNLSIDRRRFDELGGFDPEMGLRWGVEDLELGYRAEAGGARIEALPGVTAYHLDHPPADRDDNQTGNLAVFARKHGEDVAGRLASYFAGRCPLEAVVETAVA